MKQSDLIHIAMHQQLLEQAVAAERGRCLRIIEKQCVEMAREESKKMDQARREGRAEAEMFFGHGSWAASELSDRIYKEINGASMEDPIASACSEPVRHTPHLCGVVLADLRATLSLVRDLNNSAAAVFDKMRGEG